LFFYANIQQIFVLKMKYLTLILLTIVSLAAKAQLPSNELYEQFVLKVAPGNSPKGYGLTPEKPVTVGIYADMTDQQKVTAQTSRFYKTFVWADGSPVDLTSHSSTMINNQNIDQYTLVKPGTTDTIMMYVDMYNNTPISVPKGLSVYSKQQLAKEIAPWVSKVNQLDSLADSYTEEGRQISFSILGYLQRTTGLGYFMDKDVIDPLMAENQSDMDLRAFLLRSYISHKFLYAATDQPLAKIKAYNAMVKDYLNVIKNHPDVQTGALPALMKTR
jgi:hypothetical protein